MGKTKSFPTAFFACPLLLLHNSVQAGTRGSAKDRAAGKPIRPPVISTYATREAFSEIMLDEPELDPKACVTGHLSM